MSKVKTEWITRNNNYQLCKRINKKTKKVHYLLIINNANSTNLDIDTIIGKGSSTNKKYMKRFYSYAQAINAAEKITTYRILAGI